MREQIEALKEHVRGMASQPGFLHYKWFVTWHLEIVERLANELLEHHADADAELVEVMVWMHDYGKMIDFDNQYEMTLTAGRERLIEFGFPSEFTAKVISYIEKMDRKLEIDIAKTPIEVQIVSSADGCSHMVGPFMKIFWNEATDKTFAGKSYDELMTLNLEKLDKDWNRKIVLPEARLAFQKYYDVLTTQAGRLPESFFSAKSNQ